MSKEFKAIEKEFKRQVDKHPKGLVEDNFITSPDPDNIFQWYFCIFGLEKPFNGFYLGRIDFPDDYPWKPPAIRLLTPTGKFVVNASQCLTISEHHPEGWDPIWTVSSLIVGVISFMLNPEDWNGQC